LISSALGDGPRIPETSGGGVSPSRRCTTSQPYLKRDYTADVVEIVFMMLVLKLPVVYLAAVVYWAVRAEPRPPEEALLPAADDLGPQRWHPRPPRRNGPHGSPERRDGRRVMISRARA
jgi:hypothetical protein